MSSEKKNIFKDNSSVHLTPLRGEGSLLNRNNNRFNFIESQEIKENYRSKNEISCFNRKDENQSNNRNNNYISRGEKNNMFRSYEEQQIKKKQEEEKEKEIIKKKALDISSFPELTSSSSSSSSSQKQVKNIENKLSFIDKARENEDIIEENLINENILLTPCKKEEYIVNDASIDKFNKEKSLPKYNPYSFLILNKLVSDYERRTEEYIESYGEDEYNKMFKFPNYDYDYYEKLDEHYRNIELNEIERNQDAFDNNDDELDTYFTKR